MRYGPKTPEASLRNDISFLQVLKLEALIEHRQRICVNYPSTVQLYIPHFASTDHPPITRVHMPTEIRPEQLTLFIVKDQLSI